LIFHVSPPMGMDQTYAFRAVYAQSARPKLRGARHFPHPEGSRPKGIVSP
jgi:hypothetical protein